jgi:hypothetical protein
LPFPPPLPSQDPIILYLANLTLIHLRHFHLTSLDTALIMSLHCSETIQGCSLPPKLRTMCERGIEGFSSWRLHELATRCCLLLPSHPVPCDLYHGPCCFLCLDHIQAMLSHLCLLKSYSTSGPIPNITSALFLSDT